MRAASPALRWTVWGHSVRGRGRFSVTSMERWWPAGLILVIVVAGLAHLTALDLIEFKADEPPAEAEQYEDNRS